MKNLLRYKWHIISVLAIFLIVTIWANRTVTETSEKYITGNIENLADNNTGLLLGTSKSLSNGNNNQFFFNRIDATVELYAKGKIKNIIISGDNSIVGYNEPRDMKEELVKRGIPENHIYLDYAGFRTLDAVIRAKEIFGQKTFTVISQKFHNERAVYIARKNGINAYGYNAKEVDAYNGFKTKVRELFARDKVFIDLLFGVQPKFLGEKIMIG